MEKSNYLKISFGVIDIFTHNFYYRGAFLATFNPNNQSKEIDESIGFKLPEKFAKHLRNLVKVKWINRKGVKLLLGKGISFTYLIKKYGSMNIHIIAINSPIDNFCKKTGREIVMKRLEEALHEISLDEIYKSKYGTNYIQKLRNDTFWFYMD